jgi:hypothetical protein
MGYRSDVMAVIYPDATSDEDSALKYEQLKVLMQTTFKELMEDGFGADMEWVDGKQVLKFNITNVKWYDSYPDVQRFTAMLDSFGSGCDEDGIEGYCTEFMRVGEDYDDVEQSSSGHNLCYYLSVNREIVCDV